jgi:aryl-alcohol dehydrogenase-like predicted oxidoreductase
MIYQRLGRTDMEVSRVCLGTMTFGQQNSTEEAFDLLDRALEAGVSFFDAAELYPIPPKGETAGRTEEILGGWIRSRRCRDRIIIATKISGPGLDHFRRSDGPFGRKAIRQAIDGSRRRLGIDRIDLYQLHWPERSTNCFGRLGYAHRRDEAFAPLAEVLSSLGEEIAAGRICAVGLSNETPWGVMSCLGAADDVGAPRLASIQNPYNLLNRSFEIGLAEIAIREDVGLLAYSPLGFGTLTGKYLNGNRPARARLSLFPDYRRYTGARAEAATRDYVALDAANGLDPAQMALAYVHSRPFVTSTIIGATTLAQLDANLRAFDLVLEPAVIEAIDAIHHANPNPAP